MENQLRHILAFIVIAVAILFFAIYSSTHQDDGKIAEKGEYDLVAIQNENGQWYYEIYGDTVLLIRQEHIPAVRGQQFFASKEDAEKTARLVIRKLNANQAPSVTINELFEHGITFKR